MIDFRLAIFDLNPPSGSLLGRESQGWGKGQRLKMCEKSQGCRGEKSPAARTKKAWATPLTVRFRAPTLAGMEVHLTPEQQHQLSEFATQKGRDANTLAQEAISRYLKEEARFVEAVRLGEAALERGDYLTHEEVGKRLEQLFSVLMEVRWSTPAVEDLQRIFQHIEKDNPAAARDGGENHLRRL